MESRPAYLLLVGEGSFDPKLYRADSKETLLPPYLADVDPWMGETAADNRYALLDGGGQGAGDILPDLLVGRLPVNTITETQIVVAKIVRYETDPSPGGWNSNVVFVADAADADGDFAAEADQLPRRSSERHSPRARSTMRLRPRPSRPRIRPSFRVGTRARG